MKTLRILDEEVSDCGQFIQGIALDKYLDDGGYTHVSVGDVCFRCEIVTMWGGSEAVKILGEIGE